MPQRNMGKAGGEPLAEDVHDRLRRARLAAGFEKAAHAAKALGMAASTYQNYESGTQKDIRGVPRDALIKAAKRFKVSLDWLVTGEGEAGRMSVPIVGVAGADPEGSILFETGQGQLGDAPLLPRVGLHSVAVEVRGDSMQGFAPNGSLVYYSDRHDPPTEDLIGEICIVGTDDGRVLIKRLMRGGRRNTFDLLSLNGATLRDQKIDWAAPILAVLWPGARDAD